MEVKATIIKVPESKLQTTTYEDWYRKKLEQFGGKDYKFSRESVIPLLRDICESEGEYSITDFENGIKIHFYREPSTSEDSRYDEEFDATPSESADLYILDNGEVYYVHKGFHCSYDFGYHRYTGLKDGYEFDTSEVSDELNEKLGKVYVYGSEEGKSISSKIIKYKNDRLRQKVGQKRKALLSAVLSAIKLYSYSEKTIEISPSNQSMGM